MSKELPSLGELELHVLQLVSRRRLVANDAFGTASKPNGK